MRLLHTADLHLGFRQYARIGADGRNVRESDITATFRRFIDHAIALAPDAILIAGDIFHSVRPGNGVVVDAFTEFARLMQALPSVVVVMVAGNHDSPRSTETGSILRLFAALGIHVVERDATRLAFPALNLSVLAVPDTPQTIRPAFDPDPSAKYNVLLIHGEVQGMTTRWHTERAAVEIPVNDLKLAEWDYVALGHYHVHRQLAPNMAYSGSIDYTSSNYWGELAEERSAGLPGKGFVERNLDTGEQTFHPLPASRVIIDLPTFSAHETDAEDMTAAIVRTLEAIPGGVEGKVLRLKITDVPQGMVRSLNHKALKPYLSHALNLFLDFRRPNDRRFGVKQLQTAMKRKPLEQIFAEFMAERFADRPEMLAALMSLGDHYMAEAQLKLDELPMATRDALMTNEADADAEEVAA